ncbi:unnamed protein product [Amaranthus hypochondriacus]
MSTLFKLFLFTFLMLTTSGVDDSIMYGSERRLLSGECYSSGHICSDPDGYSQECCSGSCVPHSRLKIFVCA